MQMAMLLLIKGMKQTLQRPSMRRHSRAAVAIGMIAAMMGQQQQTVMTGTLLVRKDAHAAAAMLRHLLLLLLVALVVLAHGRAVGAQRR
jgi:hypothetical protein